MSETGRRGSLTFGRKSKLRGTDEFSSVFRFKRTKRGTLMDVYVAPNNVGYARLGLVVGKKTLPGAVERNQVRRVLREVFRLRQRDLAGLDVVIRVKVAADAAAYRRECEDLLGTALRHAGAAPRRE